MEESDVKQLVKDALDEREQFNQYNPSPIANHMHNGTDSPQVDASNLAGTLGVGHGGTGTLTLAAHGVVVGNGTNAVSVTGTGTSGQVLTSNGASADPTFQTLSTTPATTTTTFTAGEAITAGNALAVGTGNQYDNVIFQTQQNSSTGASNWYAQSFIAPANGVSKVTLRLTNGGGSASSVTVSVRLVTAGVIGGSDVGGYTATLNATTAGEYIFDFGGVIPLQAGSVYAIVIKGLSFGGSAAQSVFYQNTDVYANGSMYTSSNSGSTWSQNATQDLYFRVTGGDSVAGQVYKTNASSQTDLSDNFIGFATQTVASGASVIVDTSGIDTHQSGLTTGVTYYLSNTSGAIATSAGTLSRKVGLATSATSILIKHDNV